MANGDKAAAAGLYVVPPTADVRMGYDDINVRGDELAEHMVNGGHPAAKITGLVASAVKSGPTSASTVQADLDFLGTGVSNAQATANAAQSTATAANNSAATRALNYGGNAEQVRYAQGPTADAYARSVSGGGFFQVWMDSSLQFGRNTSSERYKEDIEPHHIDPAAVLALQPVIYHRIGSPEGEYEYGLIAEAVEEHVPELVIRMGDQVDGVRYDLLAVALLSVVQDQADQLADLRATVETMKEA